VDPCTVVAEEGIPAAAEAGNTAVVAAFAEELEHRHRRHHHLRHYEGEEGHMLKVVVLQE